MLPPKGTPAYTGARFDVNGNCLSHSDVRMCRLTNDGQYKIVRKTCHKCGSAAFMTSSRKIKTSVHGYKKKGLRHREIPSELLTAGDGGSRPSTPSTPKNFRRARTLSPRRSRTQKSPTKKPLSTSHVLPKLSNNEMKALMHIKPPFMKSPSNVSCSHSNSNSTRKSGGSSSKKQEKININGIGHCNIHPNVELAITRTKKSDGTWDVEKDACPSCRKASADFNCSALVVYDPKMNAKRAAEEKVKNSYHALPNSTARMARRRSSDKKKDKTKGHTMKRMRALDFLWV